ncbi:MAG: Cys-Gln thioester bond-forming surface protein [Gracilibacteraceae bacterium]|nr:Cys-Gln thioester bond-forming surface protein [Gracilibacteraceae bacterium]
MKKLMSLFLAVCLLATSFIISVPQAVYADNEFSVYVKPDSGLVGKLLYYKGGGIRPAGDIPVYYLATNAADHEGNTQQYPVYCFRPGLPGPVEIGQNLAVDLEDTEPINNPILFGILKYGYPYRLPWDPLINGDYGTYVTAHPEELNIDTQKYMYGAVDEDEAYYVTKMAVWAYLLDPSFVPGSINQDYLDNPGWIYYDLVSDAWRDSHNGNAIVNTGLGALHRWDPAGNYTGTINAVKDLYLSGMKWAQGRGEVPTVTLVVDKAPAIGNVPDPLDADYISATYTVTATKIDTSESLIGYSVAFDQGFVPVGSRITDINNVDKTTGFAVGDQFKVLVPKDEISGISGTFDVNVTALVKDAGARSFVGYPDLPPNLPSNVQDVQDFLFAADDTDYEGGVSMFQYDHEDTWLDVKKFDADNNPLAGAVFEITKLGAGTPFSTTGTTDASGTINVPLTESGAYLIGELSPPAGYEMASSVTQTVQVEWGDQAATATFTNPRRSGLVIEKYEITEISPPPGYEPSIPASKTVNLAAGGGTPVVTVAFQNLKKPGIQVLKVDALTSLTLFLVFLCGFASVSH